MLENRNSRILTAREVMARTGLPKSTLHWYASMGMFPRPFVEDAIEAWLAHPVKPKRPTVMERFESKIERIPFSGCWIWTACSKDEDGYGEFGQYGQSRGAHRVAYELFVGPIPEGTYVLHRCDVRPCVNPAHLFVGTHGDNMRDAAAKGRLGVKRGELHERAKLRSEDVSAMRSAENQDPERLSKRYAVSKATIYNVIGCRTWKHLLHPLT